MYNDSFLNIEQDSFYRKDALTQEVLYTANSKLIKEHFKSNPIGNQGFWEHVHDKEIAHHQPVVQDVINFYSGVISSKLKKVSIKNNDAYNELLHSIFHEDNQQDFRQLVEETVRKTLIYGDICFKIEYDNTITETPLITIVNGLNVEYVVKKNRIVECIFKEKYTNNDREYILVERRGRGFIKYNLYEGEIAQGNEVELSKVPELSDLEPELMYDGDMMAIPFRFWKHPTNEHRGLPLFSNKVDVINRLDEIGSALNIAVRKAEPHIMYNEKVLGRKVLVDKPIKNEAGFSQVKEVVQKKPLKGQDFIVMNADQPDPHRMPKWMEAIQTDIQSNELASAKKMALDDVFMGIISPESLGINMHKPSDNATAQRDREKITIHKINEMIDYLVPLLKNIITKTLQFTELITEIYVDTDNEFEIIFLSYGDETFKERVINIVQARPGENVVSKLSALAYLFPEKSESWIFEEYNRLMEESNPHDAVDYDGLTNILVNKNNERSSIESTSSNVMDGDGEERDKGSFGFYKDETRE